MSPKKPIAKKKVTKKATSKDATRRNLTPSDPGETFRNVQAELVDASDERQESLLQELSQETESPQLQEEDFNKADFLAPSVAPTKNLTTHDPIALYLQEVRRYPVLSREKELELAKKYYETKDPLAAQALVTANLRFVVKVAAEYSKFGAKMIDLIQEGNMGLMHAVREFNPYKGARLITYAVWWIRGYIQEYMMKQYSLVKIGTTQNQKRLFYRLQKEKRALEALGHSADLLQIGHNLGIPEEEVIEMAQRLKGRDVSLNAPSNDGDGPQLVERQSLEEESVDEVLSRAEEIEILKANIDALRPSLNEREKILLEERLLADDPLTLQEIGEKYGITREAVRQAEVRLMDKIKRQFEK